MSGHGAVVRVAGAQDAAALAELRALWSEPADDPDFVARMSAWLADEGDRRTNWLATRGAAPVGMASLFEYRRMPRPGRQPSRWGYVSNMFVREEHRDVGVGGALLKALVDASHARGYVRLVLSPSARALRFYARHGFVTADGAVGPERLLVRVPPSR